MYTNVMEVNMQKECSICKEKKQHPTEFTKYKKNNGEYSTRSCCKKCYNNQRREYDLRVGRTKRMQGMPVEDLTGKKINNFTILSYAGQKVTGIRNRHIWLCQCDCGNTKEITDNGLKHSPPKSCGCMRKGKSSPLYKGCGDISGSRWWKLKRQAKRRNIQFNISIEYAWDLFIKQDKKCALTGEKIYFGDRDGEYGNTSLDRIDSSSGYVEGNVQWVNADINRLKWDLDQDYFIKLCEKVYKYNKGKK